MGEARRAREDGAGVTLIVGSGPFEPVTHKLVAGDIAVQTRATIRNIAAILETAGASLQDVVQVTVYLKDIGDFEGMNEEACAPAGRLLVIDAVAYPGGRRQT